MNPDGMSLSEWQMALRRQAAIKERFVINENDTRQYQGYYIVNNPTTHHEYSVVYRGEQSRWNYCSCMDFRTNQLGTCKHLEAVKVWIKDHNKTIHTGIPPYSSMYLSYVGERKVCLRIGSNHSLAFKKLAEPYFNQKREMLPDAFNTIWTFMHDAVKLDDTFRIYPDALDFILQKRERQRRENILSGSYGDSQLDTLLKVKLYPYQKEGIRFAFKAGKCVIADEMGLGKTIQAIGVAQMLKNERLISSVLVICPTSLKYQWKKEIEKFTNLTALVVEGNHLVRMQQYKAEEFIKIVSYNSIANDLKVMSTIHSDMVIMDEVQRLKNWKTQISQAARRIESDYTVVLSGTPLENKLEELYSIMQFVDQYCLGPFYQFMADTAVKNENGKIIGYKNLNSVGEKMKDVLIRRRKAEVALQLPERMDKIVTVPMTDQQMEMHDEWQLQVSRLVYKWRRLRFLSESDRKKLLKYLSLMRMVCDSTYIIDQKSRYDTKVGETIDLLRDIFESGDEKVVIFSQWERMTRLIAAELDKMEIRYEYLHGGVPSVKRRELTENFSDIPDSRVFISTDAGSTGLNLQSASIIINLDLPWNPAVLEQRIARIYRIGQKRNIQVINFVSQHTIEERMLGTLNFKTSLFQGILDNGEDTIFLEDSKFDKLMSSIEVITEPAPDEKPPLSNSIDPKEQEEAASPSESGESGKQPEEVSTIPDYGDDQPKDGYPELPFHTKSETEQNTTESPQSPNQPFSPDSQNVEPQKLIQQGFSFLHGLANTLSSTEATQKLLDTIIEEDKTTGQTSLRIPVPNKKIVSDFLSLIGKMMNSENK